MSSESGEANRAKRRRLQSTVAIVVALGVLGVLGVRGKGQSGRASGQEEGGCGGEPPSLEDEVATQTSTAAEALVASWTTFDGTTDDAPAAAAFLGKLWVFAKRSDNHVYFR